jgi:hypothetical protein
LALGGTDFEPDVAWAQICSSRAARFLLGASSGSKAKTTAQYSAVGLQRDHSYAILDVQEVPVEAGASHAAPLDTDALQQQRSLRLVKLRNPWGSGEWKVMCVCVCVCVCV